MSGTAGPGGAGGAGRVGGPLRLIGVAAATSLVWLLLAGSLEVAEVVVAVLVGIGAAAFGAFVRWVVGHRHAGARRWLRELPGIVVGAYADAWLVARAALRALVGRGPTGRFRVVAYPTARGTRDIDVGRRVLSTLGTTVQPNSIVIGFDPARQLVLIHELVPIDGDPVVGDPVVGDPVVGDPVVGGSASDDPQAGRR